MWEVKFDDGMHEDMDFNELRLCYAGRPIRKNPVLGRQLCALELFCGHGIVSQEFAERKWKVRSIDVDPRSYATDVVDIMKIRYQDIGMVPDFIWASPPCHTYSNLSGGQHRSNKPGQYEKSEEARYHNRVLAQMCLIMRWAKSKKTHLIVAIENPVGMLQFMPLMKEMKEVLELEEVTVHYCAFGRDDKKPTMIWTNSFKLRTTLSSFTCKNKKCPYNGGIHPDGVRGNGHRANFAAIPELMAEEIAHNVDADFYEQRIQHKAEAKLTEAEKKAFNELVARATP